MCKYCEVSSQLDDIAEDWILDENISVGSEEIAVGCVISPWAKEIDINVVTSPVIYEELLTKKIPIKYCPFCGRELLSREEIMTLERFIGTYDGNCSISVIRGDKQLCAIQALEEIEHDEWYLDCKASEVINFKIVPDDYEENAVVLLISVK